MDGGVACVIEGGCTDGNCKIAGSKNAKPPKALPTGVLRGILAAR